MKDGRSRGIAIVEFSDRDSLEKSLGAHETEFEQRSINVGVSDRSSRGGGGDRNRGGRGDGGDRYSRDGRGGDRGGDRRNDRGGGGGKGGGGRDYGVSRGGGHDNREEGWSRGEARSRGNHKNSPRGAPPLPTPSLQPGVVGSSSASSTAAASSGPPTRKKLELKPRQAPVETIGERVSTSASSIFGDGKAREEVTPTAASSLNKEVKTLTIDSDKANTDNTETPKTSAANKNNKTGGDDEKKKSKDHQKSSKDKDKDSNKKDRNTPRGDKKIDNKDRKGGDKDNNSSRKGNTPKSQERRTPTGGATGATGGGDSKPKRAAKAEKEKDTSEETAEARFLAANEKHMKPLAAVVTKPKKVNTFSALMDDDSDSDGSS